MMRETNPLIETDVLNCQQLLIRHVHQINCCHPTCRWLRSKDTFGGLTNAGSSGFRLQSKMNERGFFYILWRYAGISVNSMSENANLSIIRGKK